MLHIPTLRYLDISVTYPPGFHGVTFVIISPCLIEQYLWNIDIEPAIGCSGCSPLGEKVLWNRTTVNEQIFIKFSGYVRHGFGIDCFRLEKTVSQYSNSAEWRFVLWECFLFLYVSGDCWHHRAHSRLAPSQWETSLQSNTISPWLGTNLESALTSHMA